MSAGDTALAGRLAAVRRAIAAAAARAGRDPAAVRLVGVVKTVPLDLVRSAVALGLRDLGENRVQEAEPRIEAIGRRAVTWHMIGHLQRNKAARAVGLFDRVHGVDGLAVAQALARHAHAAGRRLAVLVEVNISGEASKHGVGPADAVALVREVAALPGLDLDGLMTVGRAVEQPEGARAGFAELRRLRDAAEQAVGRALPELSMGMSGDFAVAVEEGATMVRVGTALFGGRA